MDRITNDTLTVAEAKRRIRDLGARADPGYWVREHPWDAVAIAFFGGLLAGTEPKARRPLSEALAHVLADRLVASSLKPEKR